MHGAAELACPGGLWHESDVWFHVSTCRGDGDSGCWADRCSRRRRASSLLAGPGCCHSPRIPGLLDLHKKFAVCHLSCAHIGSCNRVSFWLDKWIQPRLYCTRHQTPRCCAGLSSQRLIVHCIRSNLIIMRSTLECYQAVCGPTSTSDAYMFVCKQGPENLGELLLARA